ncbi:MAG TPA: hypothetical protein VGJ74_04480 [Burkholderiales bacterium]|jgi:hypothetical protein
MRFDYPNLETLNARARRERAQAVYQLLVLPVVRFFAAQPRKLRASRWLAVHGR